MAEIDDELAVLCLTAAECNVLNRKEDALDYLDDVTKMLQADDLTMDGARGLFKAVIENYPEAESKIGVNARIIKYPNFENGIVKILQHQERSLNEDESIAVEKLLKPMAVPTITTTSIGNARNNLKQVLSNVNKRRKIDSALSSNYINVDFICPTSNIVERLFSRCKFTLTSLRTNMTPDNLESSLFLLYNRSLWKAETLSKCGIKDDAEDGKDEAKEKDDDDNEEEEGIEEEGIDEVDEFNKDNEEDELGFNDFGV